MTTDAGKSEQTKRIEDIVPEVTPRWVRDELLELTKRVDFLTGKVFPLTQPATGGMRTLAEIDSELRMQSAYIGGLERRIRDRLNALDERLDRNREQLDTGRQRLHERVKALESSRPAPPAQPAQSEADVVNIGAQGPSAGGFTSIGKPEPAQGGEVPVLSKEWVENTRGGFHGTYNGGHREKETREAFHHGMDTVFNWLAERGPQIAESAAARGRQEAEQPTDENVARWIKSARKRREEAEAELAKVTKERDAALGEVERLKGGLIDAANEGKLVKISVFIKRLQDIHANFADTCVFFREAKWGAAALWAETYEKCPQCKSSASGRCQPHGGADGVSALLHPAKADPHASRDDPGTRRDGARGAVAPENTRPA